VFGDDGKPGPARLVTVTKPSSCFVVFRMSRLLSRQGQATLRCLGGSYYGTITRDGTRTLSLASRQSIRCYASERQKEGSTFKGQMLESVQSRIAREKQERAKFAAERQTTAGSRAWGITFSTSMSPVCPQTSVLNNGTLTHTLCSVRCWCFRIVLPWHLEPA
jgi:hypothetical protein